MGRKPLNTIRTAWRNNQQLPLFRGPYYYRYQENLSGLLELLHAGIEAPNCPVVAVWHGPSTLEPDSFASAEMVVVYLNRYYGGKLRRIDLAGLSSSASYYVELFGELEDALFLPQTS